MIHAYRWDTDTRTACVADLAALTGTAADLGEGDVLWLDLAAPTPEEEELVFGRYLPVHPLTREDITRPTREPDHGAHLPKVEEFPGYLFAIVNPLPAEVCGQQISTSLPGKWHRPQLSAVLTKHLLITHHLDVLPCIETVRGYVGRRTDTFGRGPDFLFHLILDEMVDEYAPVVEQFADRLDTIETALFRTPSKKILTRLLRLKRQVLFLRKTLVMEREVLSRLVRAEFDTVSSHEIAYYRNVYDHLVRYTELVEGAREMVSDLMQTHLAAASNRLNEVMKVLTMISTMILPMTLIAGVYGMNFHKGMPELEWEYGYAFSLGLMGLVGIAGLALFRWRKWI